MSTTSLKIVGIAGSLRQASYSRMVLNTVADMLAERGDVIDLDIGAIPHYCEDLEHHQLPEIVAEARTVVAACDAVIIATPEFNHGLPGVLKNTLDWLSRPAFVGCMVGKPVFFITLSPGALGGVRAQAQLRETLASMLCRLIPLPEMAITHVAHKVQDGVLSDQGSLDFIALQLATFLRAIGHAGADAVSAVRT